MDDLTTILPASFRDPAGFVYKKDGVIYRQINKEYTTDYENFIGSGLYQSLTEKNMLLSHKEVSQDLAFSDQSALVLKPTPLKFVSYPYEWSFSQLKDAALLTLDIAKIALDKDMCLKDASAYNIQFHNGNPVFIDTLSFAEYIPHQPWVAYRQFCQHFLAALSLMSKKDIRLNSLLSHFLDGVPLDLAANLLPFSSNFNLTTALHIKLHAHSQKKHANDTINPKTAKFSKNAFYGLLHSLRKGVSSLKWNPSGTEWHDYYQNNNNYSPKSLNHKELYIDKFIQTCQPDTVWDIGANTGQFSRIAANHAATVIAWDIDPACVEKHYLSLKNSNVTNILPLLQDITNPSAGIGWNHQERYSLSNRSPADVVLALGLIHHLAISNNLPLKKIAQFFSDFSKHLIIEFIPKQDSQVNKLLSTRKDIFINYNQQEFETAFKQFFNLQEQILIPDTQRVLYRYSKISL